MPANRSSATGECPSCRDALVRVVGAAEALDAGDVEHGRGILAGLEGDLARAVGADARPHRCPYCPLRFRWPGERDAHVDVVHDGAAGEEAAA